MMPLKKKVWVYARTHDVRGKDKVLVVQDGKSLTLPKGDVSNDTSPEFVIHDVLEEQTGLGLYPDRRPKGIIRFCDAEFIEFPVLEGRLIAGDAEILCYGMTVNEKYAVKKGAMWMPWWSLRWDERINTMTRFTIALLYAGMVGWEIKLDDQGNWTLPYFCIEDKRNHTVDDILSGKVKIGVYDTFDDYVSNITQQTYNKPKPSQPKNEVPKCDNWLFNIMRKWGMI